MWLGYEDSNLGMTHSEFGGYDGIRTCDPIIMSDVL